MTEAETRRQRLEATVRDEWGRRDPEGRVASTLRPDGKVDLRVVSTRFKTLDDRDREALFWPVFESVPREDLIYMTYCLLLTPEEEALHFSPGTRELREVQEIG